MLLLVVSSAPHILNIVDVLEKLLMLVRLLINESCVKNYNCGMLDYKMLRKMSDDSYRCWPRRILYIQGINADNRQLNRLRPKDQASFGQGPKSQKC